MSRKWTTKNNFRQIFVQRAAKEHIARREELRKKQEAQNGSSTLDKRNIPAEQ